ncbi:hypothetical protein NDU88_006028 [Pleurodeles waltl]|uniref:t-SNARE coiled-coil homology domain-containing protein n=1 Tax=Pleurodeles waltl TaxID=8319 RepID=A0AAV7SNB9_PLEWA|nr:hypothetical protein NDU88_006028 [Pleurodeles waltl]
MLGLERPQEDMAAAPARELNDVRGGQMQDQTSGAEKILMELRDRFCAIDNRFDLLTTRLDNMSSRLDKHQSHLEGAEGRISIIEGNTAMLRKQP